MTTAAGLPQTVFWLVMCAVFVLFSAFYSGSETGLYCVNRLRLRLAAHEKRRAAVQLLKLLSDQPGLLFTTLLGTNAANYLAPVCLTLIFLGTTFEHRAELYTTAVLTPVVFIFGEVVPKNLFQRHADRYMLHAAGLLASTYWVVRASGLMWLQKKISQAATRNLHRPPAFGSALHTRAEMYQMLRESVADGVLSSTQIFMLERIPTLKSIRLATVMVPRSRTVMIGTAAFPGETEKIVRTSPFSRMPVYEGRRTHVIGIVHVLDLLTAPPGAPITQHVRPPVQLAHDMPVIEALSTLQHNRRRMAIVVDRAGNCVGIVTVKDLVEEIVGELTAW